MKGALRLDVAFVFAGLLVAPAAWAEEPASPSEDASSSHGDGAPSEVIVQGPRRADRGTSVESIDEHDIERGGAPTVEQALERLPSIQGANDSRGERIFSLRGFAQREIAVFIDGVPSFMPYDGQVDLGKLPVDMVGRITIVKGAGTLLYGPNGLGGAVAISTRDPGDALSIRATTEAAPFTASRGSIVASSPIGPAKGIVGVGYTSVLSTPLSGSFNPTVPIDEDGGQRNNSDRFSGSVATKWTFDLGGDERLFVSGSVFEGRFGVPPAAHDLQIRYWRWPDWYARTVSVGHGHSGTSFSTEEMFYASFFGNTLDAFDDGRYATQNLGKAFHSVYDDYAVGGVIRTLARLPLGGSREMRVRTWSGARHDAHAGTGAIGAPTLRATTTVLTTSGQAEVDLVPRKLTSTVGFELDGELPGKSPVAGDTHVPAVAGGPLVALDFSPVEKFSIDATVAWRSRFPTLRERFSTSFDGRLPNPSLGAERATNLAVDAVVKPSKGLRFAASFFDSEITNLITPVVVAIQTEQLQNIGRSRLLGGEFSAEVSPVKWFEAEAGWMVIHARTSTIGTENAELDQPLFYQPAEKGTVSVTFLPWILAISASMRHVGAQHFQNPNTLKVGELGGYQLFDARLEVAPTRALRAWMRLTNILDTNVEPRFSFPEPGRQFFIGLASQVGP